MKTPYTVAREAFLASNVESPLDAFTAGWDAGRKAEAESDVGLNEIVERAHGLSRAKGWYDADDGSRNIPEMLALIHSEVSEALEDYRNGNMKTNQTPGGNGKPCGFPSELADVVIRIADLCGYLKIDLAEEVRIKHAFNMKRPHRHGGKV